MTERWLPVPGWEGFYEVSDQGRVRSLDRQVVYVNGPRRNFQGRELRAGDSGGSMLVSLHRDNRGRSYRVHTLVLTAFVGPCPPGLECCHWDGDYTNNRLGNLRWDTSSANNLDAVRHGTHRQTRKTHCKRGHLLVEPNLVNDIGRKCRSCAAGRAAFHNGHATDIQTYADTFYQRLAALTSINAPICTFPY